MRCPDLSTTCQQQTAIFRIFSSLTDDCAVALCLKVVRRGPHEDWQQVAVAQVQQDQLAEVLQPLTDDLIAQCLNAVDWQPQLRPWWRTWLDSAVGGAPGDQGNHRACSLPAAGPESSKAAHVCIPMHACYLRCPFSLSLPPQCCLSGHERASGPKHILMLLQAAVTSRPCLLQAHSACVSRPLVIQRSGCADVEAMFLPTTALRLLHTICTVRPCHSIIAADFDELPDVVIPGLNAPLVAATVKSRLCYAPDPGFVRDKGHDTLTIVR